MSSIKTFYPGDVVCTMDDSVVPGSGTYEFNGKLFASVVGMKAISGKKDSDGKVWLKNFTII